MLSRQLFAEALDPFQTFLDVSHAGRVADPDIIVRAKRNTRNSRDLFCIEQARTKFRRFKSGLRNIGEKVECALSVDARNPRY